MRRLFFVLAASFALGVSACATHQQTPTGENYYVLGQKAFAQHDYKGAAIYFQKLIDQYPFSPYAEDAELKIGLAAYQQKHYAEAISSLGDFEKMHPTSKEIELASYYLAMAHYDQIGRPDQDQSNTEQALEQFEVIERRYPETGFAALAHQQIAICREMLARHQLLIGDFYYKKANFRAAESRLAELMQKWPDTPVGDEALFQLGTTLEKEGKKYSAAQAFTAVVLHYPGTTYAAKAQSELKKLHQHVDTEEDPLHLVLTESGFGDADQVRVRQGDATTLASTDAYPPLPILKAPSSTPATPDAAAPSDTAAPDAAAADASPAPSKSSGSAGGAAAGAAPAGAITADAATPASIAAAASGLRTLAHTGPATLNKVRLSSADPPLSVILDLTGPVAYENQLQGGSDSSTLTLHLKETRLAKGAPTHLVFDRSIFHDCDIQSDADGTTITVNTSPVSRFAVVPLNAPPRLLVTFTPAQQPAGASEPEPPGGDGEPPAD
ncbi:MAG TPA: outer membrane protein assembly factor BamD [Candidatus Binataceae bacterium]|nr:outer membrane protein assembly factor BamD [Candidatus Binataceae bacterium]